MKITGRVLISLIAIVIIDLIYSFYLGITIEEKIGAAVILLILPIVSGIVFIARKTFQRKVILIVLLVLTIIMILLELTILAFTGTFDQLNDVYSYKALGVIALTFSPLIASYVWLAYMQFNEIKGKYQGRQRYLF
ncbi:hypothetical protein [uncultured Clostridium sp.]|jgi:hypothetical protein|uniref:hypothetical protein n=1 Tax=uncultured Clostridium sp. TaxID=59620 RepID=UPI00261AEAF3|nr:hypothetical protein [uncultured Clostridium sp.]